MRIKKKTCTMLLAASTAAVVGVAAVSFAAWQGAPKITASASTGEAHLEGFTKTTIDFGGDKLIPWNQNPSTAKSEKDVTMLSDTISYVFVDDYTITVSLDAANTTTSASAKYWVLISKEALTGATVSEPSTSTGWQQVTTDGVTFSKAQILGTQTAVEKGATETVNIYVKLVSNNYNGDHGKSFTFNITNNKVTA